jgi:hypothetical protein
LYIPVGVETGRGIARNRAGAPLKAYIHVQYYYILLCMAIHVGRGSEMLRTNDVTLGDEVTLG